MRMVEQLSAFVTRSSYGDLAVIAPNALKTHNLTALGCAIAALNGESLRAIRT